MTKMIGMTLVMKACSLSHLECWIEIRLNIGYYCYGAILMQKQGELG